MYIYMYIYIYIYNCNCSVSNGYDVLITRTLVVILSITSM